MVPVGAAAKQGKPGDGAIEETEPSGEPGAVETTLETSPTTVATAPNAAVAEKADDGGQKEPPEAVKPKGKPKK